MDRLHIGSGRDRREDFVNLDRVALPGVDVVADLERQLPFTDDAFDEVLGLHVLEHVDRLENALAELHRVTRASGTVRIAVPHFSFFGAYIDPTHRRFFGYETFDYYSDHGTYNFYADLRFEIVRRQIRYYWVKNERRTVPSATLTFLINLWPRFYERFLCWMLPANELYFELRPAKPSRSE